jgi:hypothetical protein
MPNQTRSKRIALSLKPEIYAVISDLADLQQKPKSQVIVDMLDEIKPMLEVIRDGLQEVKSGNDPKAFLRKFGNDLLLDGSEQLGELSKEIKNL